MKQIPPSKVGIFWEYMPKKPQKSPDIPKKFQRPIDFFNKKRLKRLNFSRFLRPKIAYILSKR